MKKIISVLALIVILSGCSASTPEQKPTDKLQIITSFYSYQLAIEEIAGDAVDVQSIYPPDSEAHSYEMTPRQTMDLQDADLVVISNPVENSKIYDVLKNNDNLLVLDNSTDDNGDAGSHTWVSPHQMINNVQTITDTLIDKDYANKATYTKNSNALEAKLKTIDKDYTEFGKTQVNPIIITHDAYGSLVDDYNMKFITLYGQHHDDEPTSKEILNTIDTINNDNISTIFVEQDDTSNKVIHQIGDETSSTVEIAYNLETESTLKSFNSVADFYSYNLKIFKAAQK